MGIRNFIASKAKRRVGENKALQNEQLAPRDVENLAQINDGHSRNGGQSSGALNENVPQQGAETKQTGELAAMSVAVDTLEQTQVYDSDVPPTYHGRPGSGPIYQKTDGNVMKFTHPSGSTPLAGFTIKRGVGVGGFGEVYFAVSDAGKEVALKRIQRNLDIELRGVSHCLNLKHPNLISLYDIRYDEAGQAWVVMEYVSGDSLRSTLDRAPHGLTESETRRWFAALAAGVAHLHDAGIVHRDLKPGNIFSDEGIIKIGDYGLSKYISCSRRGGHTESVGTFHYMAPEVGRGSYGREIDIYAMGIVLYEMLTGTVPFDGESSHEIVMKHLTANPDLSGIQEPYRSVIWQALQKNPSARQQTVAQMIRPLGMVLDEHGLVRATGGSIDQPVSQQASGQYEDPGIQFAPAGSEQFVAARPANRSPQQRPQAARSEDQDGMRFGEVRYHQPARQGSSQQYYAAAAAAVPSRREEPLARAVRSTASDLSRWWTSLEPFPGTRIVLLIMGIALVVMNTGWLLPLLTMIAVIYVPYYVIRAIALGVSRQPSYAQAHYAAAARPYRPQVLTVKQWKANKRTELAAKRSSERLAELGGSTTRAVFTTGILGTCLGAFALWNTDFTSLQLAPYVWTGVVAAVGAGMILFFGKLWEREEGSSFTRRLVMLGAGAAVGAGAHSLANFLMLPTEAGISAYREIHSPLSPDLYAGETTPLLAAMAAHFAVLFAALRWWKVADPLRRSRFSIWATAVAVVAEWGLHQFLPIPQPWGMMTAGLMSVAIQFSAPWENPKQRLQTNTDATQIA